MTPNRPEATCLIAERIESPFGKGLKRSASSPPSPVFDLPPMRFIAIASVVCASRLIEPKLIAPVEKRLTILAAGSTSSSGTGSIGRAELHQAADRQQPLALVVDRRGEGLVVGERIAAHRVLQSGDALRRPGMRLAAQPERIVAAEIEHLAIERVVAIGARVADQRLLGDRRGDRRPRSSSRCR